MSGMGSDGAQGVAAIRDGGGAVLVQDPADAAFDAMPRAAIAAVPDAVVVPLARLAVQIVARIGGRDAARPGAAAVPDPAAGPEEAALGQDASARIRAAIEHLPTDQRAAITAVVYQGQSIQQAAHATGVPEGTIKSRLHRARLRIHQELQP